MSNIKKRPGSVYATAAWQRQRARVLERDGFRCRFCGAPGRQIGGRVTLSIQHLIALRIWRARGGRDRDYPDHLLATACLSCHGKQDGGRTYTRWDGLG